MKRLTDSEARTLNRHLLNSIDPRDVFIQLLFETGARVSETLNLGPQDLVGASLAIAPLKNSLPRQVTLSSNLQAKLRSLTKDRWSDSFSPGSTTDSRRRVLARHFAALTKTILGRSVNLHALRHTAFSRLYAATKDLLLVKQWAGHRSVSSTMVYMRLDHAEEANRANCALLQDMA